MKTYRVMLAGLLAAGLAVADDPPRAEIVLTWEADAPALDFELTSGTEYRVEERADLRTGDWDEVGVGHAVSGPDSHPLTSSAVSPRFFRLRYEDHVVDGGDGEEWDTFDFNVLSNRVEALQAAGFNQGDGGALVITNYVDGTYLSLTHDETTPDGTISTTRQSYEEADAVYIHLTSDTVLDFFSAPGLDSVHEEGPATHPATLSSGGTPGGAGLTFYGGHAFRDGERNRQSISVRGNVVSSGRFSYDFGQSPLGWDPPSIGKRIQDLWIQGPRMFVPYPPGPCGDSLAITNARMFSVLKSRVTLYPTQAFEETYQFLFDYCYEYTCPNGPLRKILVVLFKYHYVVRDRSTGNVVAREVQNAYFVGNEAP